MTALMNLMYDSFEVGRALIIAPLRVARDQWPAEIGKWEHLHGLEYAVAVGTEAERRAALMKHAPITIINRENVQWLVEKSGVPFDYDMIVIDELSSFKANDTKRFKALMQVRPRVKRIVGLTGTPSSNGLMDLWAEFKLLDMGKRLGRFITHYRDEFFMPDKRSAQQIFSYKPKAGAEDEIYRRIGDITISMKSTDYLTMPEMLSRAVTVTLTVTQQELYDQMRKEMVAELDDAEIDAANAASLSNKLMQMANGAVYDDERNVHCIHDQKLDALEDLIEAANGKPVLIAYWFKHDLSRIRQRFPYAREIKTSADIADWNAGKISVAVVHPASAGHGLNSFRDG